MVRHRNRKHVAPNIGDIKLAIDLVKAGSSIRSAAKTCGVNETTVRRHINFQEKKDQAEHVEHKHGGHLSLPRESEVELVACLKIKALWGFADTKVEVCDIVEAYVKQNKEVNNEVGRFLRKYCRFKDNRPGDDWLQGFMKRYKLSVKTPSSLEKVRKSAASDPNIIYGYFETLKKVIDDLGIIGCTECIWNVDETNLFTDPKQTKVVAPKGKKASRITSTSGREAMTVMAGISANGDKLPPLIIFKGKHFLGDWNGKKPYPGTQIAKSDNGWMVSDIFYDWFVTFCNSITQRPLLLVFDGHATHINSRIITKAQKENVTILKLPPHTTDKLQPLDVCCFRPLKSKWDKAIAKWQRNNNARRIKKGEFVDLVGSVWNDVFTKENIHSSFRKTGICPLSHDIYPEEMFDPCLLAAYKKTEELKNLSSRKPPTPRKQAPHFIQTTGGLTESLPSTSGIQQQTQDQPEAGTSEMQSSFNSDAFLDCTSPVSPMALPVPMTCNLQPEPEEQLTMLQPITSTPTSANDKSLNSSLNFEQICANFFHNKRDKPSTPNDSLGPPQKKVNRILTPECTIIKTEDYRDNVLKEEMIRSGKRKPANQPKKSTTKGNKQTKSNEAKDNKQTKANESNDNKQTKANENKDNEQTKTNETNDDKETNANETNDDKQTKANEESITEETLVEEPTCSFCPDQYKAISSNINTGDYYAVDYGYQRYYVGKVLKKEDDHISMQFLTYKGNNKFDWPKNKDIDNNTEAKYFICGPIKITGPPPHTINGLPETNRAYHSYLKKQK